MFEKWFGLSWVAFRDQLTVRQGLLLSTCLALAFAKVYAMVVRLVASGIEAIIPLL